MPGCSAYYNLVASLNICFYVLGKSPDQINFDLDNESTSLSLENAFTSAHNFNNVIRTIVEYSIVVI